MQDSPDVIAVMPEVELTTDDLSHPEGRPAGIRKAVDLRTLYKEAFEDVSLLLGECGRSARGDGGLERVWSAVTEAILPVADGTHRNTQELSEFLGAVRLSLEQLEKAKSTFFELSLGEVRCQPTVSHPVMLLSFISVEIIDTPTDESDWILEQRMGQKSLRWRSKGLPGPECLSAWTPQIALGRRRFSTGSPFVVHSYFSTQSGFRLSFRHQLRPLRAAWVLHPTAKADGFSTQTLFYKTVKNENVFGDAGRVYQAVRQHTEVLMCNDPRNADTFAYLVTGLLWPQKWTRPRL